MLSCMKNSYLGTNHKNEQIKLKVESAQVSNQSFAAIRLSDLELQIRSTTSQVHATRYTSQGLKYHLRYHVRYY